MGLNLPNKNMADKKFEKNTHENNNKHITMYACTKFQLISRTASDFGTKFPKKIRMTKILKK